MNHKILSFAAAVVMSVSLISPSIAAEKAKKKEVAVVLSALNSDFWGMVKTGALKGQKEFDLNMSIIAPPSESDINGQINQIEDSINKGVDGLIIAPTDSKAVVPFIEKAKKAGIPVVLVDVDLDDSHSHLRNSFVGVSQFEAGKKAGAYLATYIKPGDKVGIVTGLAGNPNHTNRVNGAKGELEKAGAKIVSIQPADSDRGKAVNVTENMLESQPDIKVIYATNDEMALGAYQAVKTKGRTDIIICGFDGSPDALKSIKAGQLKASLAQRPIDLGYTSVKALVEIMNGKKLDSRIYTDVQVVDAKNVKEYEEKLKAEVDAVSKK